MISLRRSRAGRAQGARWPRAHRGNPHVTSQKRIQANRLNALKSTGPKSDQGKANSSRNALKHGLASASPVVVPAEDAAEYAQRLASWIDDASPRGPIERALVEHACHADWKLRRAARQEATALSLVARNASDDHDREAIARAAEIGRRLLHDPINRCAVFRGSDPIIRERVDAWKRDDPEALAPLLASTARGVEWMLARWDELATILREEGYWHYDARYRALRLLGHRQEDVMHDPLAQKLMLACSVLHVEPWDLWDDAFQATLPVVGHPVYTKRVDHFRTKKPGSKEEALGMLWEVLNAEVARLQSLKVTLEERAMAERSEAAARSSLDEGPSATLRMRYEAAAERLLFRALTELAKRQKADPNRESSPVESPKVEPKASAPAPEPGPRNEPKPKGPVQAPRVRNRPARRAGEVPKGAETSG